MKFATLLALAALSNAVQETYRECYDDPEVTHVKSCRSLWYKLCDNWEIGPGATCNIMTYSDSMLTWFSDSIDVYVWNFVMKLPEEYQDGRPGDDSGTWSRRLRQDKVERTCQKESPSACVCHHATSTTTTCSIALRTANRPSCRW